MASGAARREAAGVPDACRKPPRTLIRRTTPNRGVRAAAAAAPAAEPTAESGPPARWHGGPAPGGSGDPGGQGLERDWLWLRRSRGSLASVPARARKGMLRLEYGRQELRPIGRELEDPPAAAAG